jgi:hypothetical protein
LHGAEREIIAGIFCDSGGLRLRSGFAARLGGVGQEFAFGAGPVFEGVARSTVTVEINLVGAEGDLFAGGKRGFDAGLFGLSGGGVLGCGHGSILSS